MLYSIFSVKITSIILFFICNQHNFTPYVMPYSRHNFIVIEELQLSSGDLTVPNTVLPGDAYKNVATLQELVI